MKYLRHSLLLAQIAIFVALASLLVVLSTHHAKAVVTPPPAANVSKIVATFSLDYAPLGPAAIYGSSSWKNVVGQIRHDALIDAPLVPAPYRQEFTHVAAIAKLALTDTNENDRVADEQSLVTVLDRLTLTAAGTAG